MEEGEREINLKRREEEGKTYEVDWWREYKNFPEEILRGKIEKLENISKKMMGNIITHSLSKECIISIDAKETNKQPNFQTQHKNPNKNTLSW